MKKIAFLALLLAAVMNVNATDLWTGSKHVSWADGGIQIQAAQFADAVAGQKIVVTYADATDGIEFKVMNANFDHLAGSREAAWIGGNGTFEQFLTPAAVAGLKAHGLEIIGANFNCSKVELLDGKAELKEGITVWTGYFWADSWSTLELYRDGYAGVDFSKVAAIRFYSEAASGEYVLNFLKGWGDGEKFADQTNMTDGEGYKELALTDELRAAVAGADHWMVQFNKEALSPFNVTDVVLVMMPEPDYYLVGSMNEWTENEAYKFTANPSNPGEYMLATNLTEGASLKVKSSEGTWYPDGIDNNYTVDAAHSGNVTVYFRPDGQGGNDWHYGFFYVTETDHTGISNTAVDTKAVKCFENGQLVIIKNGVKYNALGAQL